MWTVSCFAVRLQFICNPPVLLYVHAHHIHLELQIYLKDLLATVIETLSKRNAFSKGPKGWVRIFSFRCGLALHDRSLFGFIAPTCSLLSLWQYFFGRLSKDSRDSSKPCGFRGPCSSLQVHCSIRRRDDESPTSHGVRCWCRLLVVLPNLDVGHCVDENCLPLCQGGGNRRFFSEQHSQPAGVQAGECLNQKKCPPPRAASHLVLPSSKHVLMAVHWPPPGRPCVCARMVVVWGFVVYVQELILCLLAGEDATLVCCEQTLDVDSCVAGALVAFLAQL